MSRSDPATPLTPPTPVATLPALAPPGGVRRSMGLAHLLEQPHSCRMARRDALVNMQDHSIEEDTRGGKR